MGGQEGPVCMATGVGFAQIKKQIPDSQMGGLLVVYEMVKKYTAEYLGA